MSATGNPPIEEPFHDFCIIGSGAIGIALATRLAATGRSVLIIEAGDDEVTETNQEACRCNVTGRPHPGSSEGRFRVFGGSTERWGGQAMRFDEVDFTARPGVFEEGWPIPAESLSPYYPEAEKFMGMENPPYLQFAEDFLTESLRFHTAGKQVGEAFKPFQFHYSVFSHNPRMREFHRSALADSEKITIWKNSVATRLNTNGNGVVSSVNVCSGTTNRLAKAQHFILATGGIENARFLLLQRDIHALGELQKNHQIGRYFQDHPGAHIAEISGKGAAFIQDLFRLKNTASMNLKARISWSSEERARSGLLAVTGTFLMMTRPSEFDSANEGRRFRSISPSDLSAVIGAALRGKVYSPLHYTYLAVSAEDLRNRESKITLSETETAPDGSPRAVVNWVVDPRVAESIIAYTRRIDEAFVSSGLGTLRKFDFMSDPELLVRELKDNSHHIGSTGMGAARAEGVVDPNLKAFGLDNFWVAGTSVLPTGAHANPTLTALALAYRLADHLLDPRHAN